jgi:hypothetical protein
VISRHGRWERLPPPLAVRIEDIDNAEIINSVPARRPRR